MFYGVLSLNIHYSVLNYFLYDIVVSNKKFIVWWNFIIYLSIQNAKLIFVRLRFIEQKVCSAIEFYYLFFVKYKLLCICLRQKLLWNLRCSLSTLSFGDSRFKAEWLLCTGTLPSSYQLPRASYCLRTTAIGRLKNQEKC